MTIQQAQRELVEDFALFDDWTDKYEYIISMGKKLPLIDDSLKTDELPALYPGTRLCS